MQDREEVLVFEEEASTWSVAECSGEVERGLKRSGSRRYAYLLKARSMEPFNVIQEKDIVITRNAKGQPLNLGAGTYGRVRILAANCLYLSVIFSILLQDAGRTTSGAKKGFAGDVTKDTHIGFRMACGTKHPQGDQSDQCRM